MARKKGSGTQLAWLELTDDIYPWYQQKGESESRYNAFRTYLELGRGRRLGDAGTKLGYSREYMTRLAKYGQWYERARAWNRYEDQAVTQRFIERAQQAADRDMAILDKALSRVDVDLDNIDEMAPEHAIRLLDVTLKHRRALFGDPTKAAEKDPNSPQQEAPSRVEITHLDGMSDDAKMDAVREIMETNQRWLSAASETDDD